MDNPGTSEPITIKINTTFAIGNTEAFGAQFDRNGDLILELEPGTTVEELLRRLPGLGSPENWSDFISPRVCQSPGGPLRPGFGRPGSPGYSHPLDRRVAQRPF